jgi:hypothetical protein
MDYLTETRLPARHHAEVNKIPEKRFIKNERVPKKKKKKLYCVLYIFSLFVHIGGTKSIQVFSVHSR